jgi:hypothetical protein
MIPPHPEPSIQPTSAETSSSNALKYSKRQLVLAFGIAGIPDVIGAADRVESRFCDGVAAFLGAGPAVAAIAGISSGGHSGLGRIPFWLLVVGAIAALGTPRPVFERH